MIGFTNGDISDVISDVTMLLAAAVPEYQRLRAEFSTVTEEAIKEAMQHIVRGVRPEEIVDPLVYNFARFKLAHAAATGHLERLRDGASDAQDVRRAYLGAADALGATGAILRQVKGLTYAAGHVSEFWSQLVKHHKSREQGKNNLRPGAEREERRANRSACRAVAEWRRKSLQKRRLDALPNAEVVGEYLKTPNPSRRQKERLRTMLGGGRFKK